MNLAWYGRISVDNNTEIVILEHIPIIIPKKLLLNHQRLFLKFIWKSDRPRVSNNAEEAKNKHKHKILKVGVVSPVILIYNVTSVFLRVPFQNLPQMLKSVIMESLLKCLKYEEEKLWHGQTMFFRGF